MKQEKCLVIIKYIVNEQSSSISNWYGFSSFIAHCKNLFEERRVFVFRCYVKLFCETHSWWSLDYFTLNNKCCCSDFSFFFFFWLLSIHTIISFFLVYLYFGKVFKTKMKDCMWLKALFESWELNQL